MSKGMIKGKWYPSKQQEELISLMLDTDNHMTIAALCKEVGVSRPTYYTWFEKQEFIDYYNARRNRALIGAASKVDKALLAVASDADPKCNADRKLFYDKLGELKADNTQITVVFAAFDGIDRPKSFDATEVKVESLTPIRAGE